MSEDIYKRTVLYVKEHKMLASADVVIAGVSGGPDSMAMLDMLVRLGRERKFRVCAVHVNHGIRGAEAGRDQEFVEKTLRKWEIPCRSVKYDVPALASEWKTGMEEAGRRVRREVFYAEAKAWEEKGYRVRIALAHNQNDLAETMLHHLARGTGLRGLAGIQPVSGQIIRPVLCLERKEIEHYLKERGISFVEDSSNREDAYTRNRIRHHILPLMECGINTRAVKHMAETSRVMLQADAFLTEKGRELLLLCAQKDGGYLLDEAFFGQVQILKEYALMEGLGELAGKRRDITALHVKQLLMLKERPAGSRLDLPYGICAWKEYGGIRLKRNSVEEQAKSVPAEWQLPVTGKLECALGSFETEIFFYEGQEISEKKCTKWFDYDKIEYHPAVRTRRTGDYLIINQEGHRKKINRCMIDDKVPRESRSRIPLVTCGSEILWIVGGRMSENYKITSRTKRVLEIKYQGGNRNERKDQSDDQ